MHGGAVSLARQFFESNFQPDLLLATDMLDLTTFLTLTRQMTADLPVALYFHENQLTYPWSPNDRDVVHQRDRHYGFINYASALAADAVFFNSSFHKDSFFEELQRFLKHFPDHRELENMDLIRSKSQVLPLGLDLRRFDKYNIERANPHSKSCRPLILWNHRWEFDKNPTEFFQALAAVAEEGWQFEVAVLGECFSQQPAEFEEGRKRLGSKVVQFGFVEDFAEYARWLWRADILPVTSHQDFFGASVVEAVYCGCWPVLPQRLAYPELIPTELHAKYFYHGFDELVAQLVYIIENRDHLQNNCLQSVVKKYDWQEMSVKYDDHLKRVVDEFGR